MLNNFNGQCKSHKGGVFPPRALQCHSQSWLMQGGRAGLVPVFSQEGCRGSQPALETSPSAPWQPQLKGASATPSQPALTPAKEVEAKLVNLPETVLNPEPSCTQISSSGQILLPAPFSLTLVTGAKCGVGLCCRGLWTVGIAAGGEGQPSEKPQGSGLGGQHRERMFGVSPRARNGPGLELGPLKQVSRGQARQAGL